MDSTFDETLDIRLQAFCEYVDSLVTRTDEGDYRITSYGESMIAYGENVLLNEQFLLPSGCSYHELPRQDLIKIGKYLCDASLKPTIAISTTLDHLQYWAWTATVALGYYSDPDDHDIFELYNHLQTTVSLTLLPIHTDEPEMGSALSQVRADSGRLALLSTFPLLEGLICHLGKNITRNKDGYPVPQRTVKKYWGESVDGKYDGKIGNGNKMYAYDDLLQVWRSIGVSSQLHDILTDINDITRYDTDVLSRKFGGATGEIDKQEDEGTHNFFAIIKQVRNNNSHGAEAVRTLVPVMVTLCCLCIWDVISDETYEAEQNKYEEQRTILGITPETQGRLRRLYPLYPV
jgi:hypothetical protein